MNRENNISEILNALSHEINQIYNDDKIPVSNLDEPIINSGLCAPFANSFLSLWNEKFTAKVNIVFVMI